MNIDYCVIDACGEALDQVTPFPLRPDCFLQGLQTEEVIERVPAQTDIIGITCLFSQYWPVVRELAKALRAHFPGALMVLGGEHATAVPEHVLSSGHFDVCVLGEGEETFLRLIHAHRDARPFADIPGIAFLEDGQYRNNGLSPRTRDIDDIPWPDWDWTAPGLLDTRVRVFDLMRPPQLERVFPALPGPAFGSRSPRASNDGCTGS